MSDNTTTDTVGRHRRTIAGARVPTDRTHAHCYCAGRVASAWRETCPRHSPKAYATSWAQHRADPS